MKTVKNAKRKLIVGIGLVIAFVLWTILIQVVDVKPVGQQGTDIGFSTFNVWFHSFSGVHMSIYTITDWLGLVPLVICMIFGFVGLVQLIKRKSLFKVDVDIIGLGIYYVVMIFGYLIFEMVPINYRPILIEGFLEASYPSSTTLLVLSVMPTVTLQCNRRLKNKALKKTISIVVALFSFGMVFGRLIAGVHWFTDIAGGILLSFGLYMMYNAFVDYVDSRK